MPVNWALMQLRATRANPPGRAADDPTRRSLYGAALQQFDDLLDAAAASGHAGRPLPLFYALSQAGRAVVAAHGATGIVTSHGLSEERLVGGPDPLLRQVKRSRASNDALSNVCAATGAPDPYGSTIKTIELGAAWASLPAENRYLRGWDPRWRPSLEAFIHSRTRLELHVTSNAPEQAVDVTSTSYPQLPDGFRHGPPEHNQLIGVPDVAHAGEVTWPDDDSPSAVTLTRRGESPYDRWLLPAAPGSDQPFTPLTAWWVLLFGLSIFARYDPGLWVTVLNLDDPGGHALPLRLLLDQALETIPELISDALVGEAATP